MNSYPNFTEWTREEKEEYAKRLMVEMKLKNERLLQRHAEVENDRINAESQNSAITSAAKGVKKEKNTNIPEGNKEENKTEHAREWDRGKPDRDHWKSPEHQGSSFKNYGSSGRYDRRDGDRKDNWGSYSRHENTDRSWRNRGSENYHEMKDDEDEEGIWSHLPIDVPYKTYAVEDSYDKWNVDKRDTRSGNSRNESNDYYRHDHGSDTRRPRGNNWYKQNDNMHNSTRLQVSPKRTRGIGYRSNDSHRKYHGSYSEDKYKRSDYRRSNSRKRHSYRAHSRSSSRSGSDYVENQFTIRTYNLWQNDQISEDQTKQNRVERWVKSVNITNMFGDKQLASDQKDKNNSKSSSKFDRPEHTSNKSEGEGHATNLNTFSKNKSYENNKYAPQQHGYNDGKCQNKSVFHSIGFEKQIDTCNKKSVQNKRSPQFSSPGSIKNENLRKQRRFSGKGQKIDGDKNKFNPKMHDTSFYVNDTWKSSQPDNTGNKSSSYDRSSKLDIADSWNQDDDGIWGNTEQSDIKWKLNDEEADLPKAKIENKKYAKNSIDTSDNQITKDAKKSKFREKYVTKDKNESKKQLQYEGDGKWSTVEQSDVYWKSDTEMYSQECKNQNLESSNSKNKGAVKYTEQKVVKMDPGDGWEDYECQGSKSNIKRPSEWEYEKYKTNTKTSRNEKPHCSDDGDWSTVSELHSNVRNANKNKKLY